MELLKLFFQKIIFSLLLTSTIVAEHPNILFIASDDLRCTLGSYGDKIARTPNLDHLANTSTVFKRAYCQQALCNPSRASLLTGLRPDSLKIWNLHTFYRNTQPSIPTLPEYLKSHGYHTEQIGKIHHGSGKSSIDPKSWSVPQVLHNVTKRDQYMLPQNQKGGKAAATEQSNMDDHAYVDGKVANLASEALTRLSQQNKPFMLAVGFRKPHLPFSAPSKYWKLYDRKDIPLPQYKNPKHVPELALHNGKELFGYTDIKKGRLNDAKRKELWHGYYAAVSFMDAQVGKVLNQLKDLGLDKNTIVVFWSDHGFHLSEHDLWCKTSNFEFDARVPLIYKDPRIKQGNQTNALVELVDLYPTILDSCNLKPLSHLEGKSFTPLLNNPTLDWKTAAFTQHPRPAYYSKQPTFMGYSMRTDQFRYTEWREFGTNNIVASELYNHQLDPNETVNESENPDYSIAIKKLKQQLKDGWKQAIPSNNL